MTSSGDILWFTLAGPATLKYGLISIFQCQESIENFHSKSLFWYNLYKDMTKFSTLSLTFLNGTLVEIIPGTKIQTILHKN